MSYAYIIGKLTVCRSGDITVFVEYKQKLNYIFNSFEEHNTLLVKTTVKGENEVLQVRCCHVEGTE